MKWGLKGGISIDADSRPPRYVLWCCGGICHQLLTFFQIGCGHTVKGKISWKYLQRENLTWGTWPCHFLRETCEFPPWPLLMASLLLNETLPTQKKQKARCCQGKDFLKISIYNYIFLQRENLTWGTLPCRFLRETREWPPWPLLTAFLLLSF